MELLFVYNANSSVSRKLFDAIRKSVSPSTYKCKLCLLTHHNFGAYQAWKEFVETSKVPIRIFHKDEFFREFVKEIEFPTVMSYDNSSLNCILGREELSSINDLNELFVLLKEKVPELER